MSPGTQPDPDRRDADVLFSPPEIYVARPCGDEDVIDAEESGMYVVPGRPSPPRSIEPARHTQQYYTRNQHQPPSPNIVEPQRGAGLRKTTTASWHRATTPRAARIILAHSIPARSIPAHSIPAHSIPSCRTPARRPLGARRIS